MFLLPVCQVLGSKLSACWGITGVMRIILFYVSFVVLCTGNGGDCGLVWSTGPSKSDVFACLCVCVCVYTCALCVCMRTCAHSVCVCMCLCVSLAPLMTFQFYRADLILKQSLWWLKLLCLGVVFRSMCTIMLFVGWLQDKKYFLKSLDGVIMHLTVLKIVLITWLLLTLIFDHKLLLTVS